MAKAQLVKAGTWLWMKKRTTSKAEPHYGWADVVGDSSQLFSIQPREQPPGVYPNIDFGSSVPPDDEIPSN
ncbi:hypothetical protein KY290_009877 [Solanum tuberosum]|uniref:Uncharacterized protein n=1 Tax=Solanum tuberosum TaxID=4113 RepID=A0ABQ7VY92_SOLTU|nr:hypothetical protein KY290_009877 [Solanum tuberosum]